MLVWLLFACGPEAAPEPAPTPAPAPVVVHLSFDDAPWMLQKSTAVSLSAEEVGDRNRRLVAMLGERGVPASVFFNCDRLQDGDGAIEAWASAGHVVGNHSASHPSLNQAPVEDWLADVRRCDEVLEARLPSPPTWFRYPHLHQGSTPEARQAAADGIVAMGYRNAPVSVATTEWMLAFAYRRALKEGDAAKQAEIAQAYQVHMDDALAAAQEMAIAVEGHDVAQIVLVHVNELAVDHLGGVLDAWGARGVRFVSLDEAMQDPVYARPDVYVGWGGLSWLARLDPDRPNDAPYWFGDEEERIVARFGPTPTPGE